MIKHPEIWIIILDKETKEVIAERSTGFWGEVLYLKNRLKKDYENWIKKKEENKNKEELEVFNKNNKSVV